MEPKSKLKRQLLILHIFHYCHVTEYAEIMNLIENVSRRTIDRDISELMEAGLLSVSFSRKENGFVHSDRDNLHNHPKMQIDNKAKQAHFDKLIRLSRTMFEFWPEEGQSIMDWYAENFPDISKRTQQRDFQILNELRYRIRYDYYEKQYSYDFPLDMMSIF